VNSKGLRVSVESSAKSMHATSYINHELLSEFNLPMRRGEGTEVQFKVNISTLLECLSLYGLHNLNLTAAIITFSEADG
jgi:hypothetical protein